MTLRPQAQVSFRVRVFLWRGFEEMNPYELAQLSVLLRLDHSTMPRVRVPAAAAAFRQVVKSKNVRLPAFKLRAVGRNRCGLTF